MILLICLTPTIDCWSAAGFGCWTAAGVVCWAAAGLACCPAAACWVASGLCESAQPKSANFVSAFLPLSLAYVAWTSSATVLTCCVVLGSFIGTPFINCINKPWIYWLIDCPAASLTFKIPSKILFNFSNAVFSLATAGAFGFLPDFQTAGFGLGVIPALATCVAAACFCWRTWAGVCVTAAGAAFGLPGFAVFVLLTGALAIVFGLFPTPATGAAGAGVCGVVGAALVALGSTNPLLIALARPEIAFCMKLRTKTFLAILPSLSCPAGVAPIKLWP